MRPSHTNGWDEDTQALMGPFLDGVMAWYAERNLTPHHQLPPTGAVVRGLKNVRGE